MASFIDLVHVNVVRGGRHVLHDINLSIESGEHIALLGPNGCGKSTLLKTISCELYPLAEPTMRVSILGSERWDLTQLKRKLGVVQNEIPGKPMLNTTGRDAVLTGFFSSSTLWPNLVVTPQMQTRADDMIERIGATGLRQQLFGEMSAGQQKRILIGRALVISADCLLLDEPSNALDIAAQRDLRDLTITLAARGTTILHITHHIGDIIPAMKRVLLMQDGRIVADGAREELLTEPVLSDLFRTPVNLTERNGFVHAW
jgi:iron complex transport system ATP-binding protein